MARPWGRQKLEAKGAVARGRLARPLKERLWKPGTNVGQGHGQGIGGWEEETCGGQSRGQSRRQAGLQKVGTAGSAGAGQITFGWTK